MMRHSYLQFLRLQMQIKVLILLREEHLYHPYYVPFMDSYVIIEIQQSSNHQNNMPISLSNLTQLLQFKLKSTAAKHKKKIIVVLVLAVVGYIAKKKLTIAHVLSCVQFLTKCVQALPLPEAPRMRTLAQYQHPSSKPLKAIMDATRLQDLKKKIGQKKAGWQDLKQAILTCTTLTLTIYNANSLYFLIQTKYRQQFLTLNSSTQFEQAMYQLRKRFTQDIPLLFQQTKELLKEQLFRIDMGKQYDLSELEQIFGRLSSKIFEGKFDKAKEQQYTIMGRCKPESKNFFQSIYEYIPEKTSILTKVTNVLGKCLGGAFHLGEELLPTPTIEVTSERYAVAKTYVQSLKKASNFILLEGHENPIEWPSATSKQLFQLILEELQFTFTSLNFNILLKAHSNYNLKTLQNRLRLLFALKRRQTFKMTELLPLLTKILQEQFYKPNVMELRERYYNGEVKKAIKVVAEGQREEEMVEGKSIEEDILEEIQLKNSFDFLEKELELKLFNERSGVVMRPKKAGNNEHQAQQIKKLLGMMGSSQVLNEQG